MYAIDEESVLETPTNLGRKRLDSNSSHASDISFLPTYESPVNLYHLQSDLDVSASEVEDVTHVDKTQTLNAYKNALSKYNKYRGRYSDLAHHYRILEKENAKTRAVLVETQDKALRRIAELKEQCSLEQSAKAHIEQVLREDLNEKQILVDTLNTKIQLLQHADNHISNADEVNQLRARSNELELELQQTKETHLNAIESVREAFQTKMVALENETQEHTRRLEEKLKEKEMEMKTFEEKHQNNKSQTDQTLINKAFEVLTKKFGILHEGLNEELIRKIESTVKEMNETREQLERRNVELELKLQETRDTHLRIMETVQESNKTKLDEKEVDLKRLEEEQNRLVADNKSKDEFVSKLSEFFYDKFGLSNILNNSNITNELELAVDQDVKKRTQELEEIRKEFELVSDDRNALYTRFNDENQRKKKLQTLVKSLNRHLQSARAEQQTLLDTTQTQLLQIRSEIMQQLKMCNNVQIKELESVKKQRDRLTEEVNQLKQTRSEEHDVSVKEAEKLKEDLAMAHQEALRLKKEMEAAKVETTQKFEETEQLLTSAVKERDELLEEMEQLKMLEAKSRDLAMNERNELLQDFEEKRTQWETTLTSARNERDELKEKSAHMLNEIERLTEKMTAVELECNNLELVQHKLTVATNELEQLKASVTVDQLNAGRLKSIIDSVTAERDQLKQDIENTIELLASATKERDQLLDELEQLKKDSIVDKLDLEHLQSITKERDQFKQEIDQLRNELEQLKVSLSIDKLDSEHLHSVIDSVTEERDQFKQEINRLLAAETLLATVTTERDLLKMHAKGTRDERERLSNELVQLLEDQKRSETELNELKSQLATTQEEKQSLVEKIARSDETKLELPKVVSETDGNCEEINRLDKENNEEKILELRTELESRESNIQYYQNEVLRLQNTNEKLATRLDETLVALNHCAELSSSSTEIQYLRNVLYNYMVGKESLVLARVIAAVCKFNPEQTDAVLQKEQQKQTLLGHLGLL